MARRIYVGSLPHSIDNEQLKQLFVPHGQVDDVHVIIDRETGQARGFAFVEMPIESEAQAAIQHLNGTELDGSTLVVNEARARERTASGPR